MRYQFAMVISGLLLTGCRLFSGYEFVEPLAFDLDVDLRDFVTGDPVMGMRVCVVERPELPCVESAENGRARMGATAPGALTLAVDGAGYVTLNWSMDLKRDLTLEVTVLTTQLRDLVGTMVDPTPDFELGFVVVTTADEVGATVSVDPADGDGPVYPDEFGLIDMEDDVIVDSLAIVYNLPAGRYEARLMHPEQTCGAGFDAWATDEGGVEFEVVDGVMIVAGPMFCDAL